MAKIYYTNGTGLQQTLTPANKSNIPIYANKTAMEADASNIPDGAIVFTKSDHDDVIGEMKAYIRNQNVLSDFEDVTISTDSNNPTVMDKDGELILGKNGVWNHLIFINGLIIGTSNPTSSGIYCPPIPFSKGDSIYVSPNFYSYFKARFYNLRDYSDR